MTLSNKRTQYSVEETGTNLSLKGEVNVNDTAKTISMNGSFEDANGEYIGSFNYSERENNNVDKNINGVRKALVSEAEDFLTATIQAIYTELQLN
jgi:hypothetical protein